MPSLNLEHLSALQQNPKNIKNICILAHVDHGKTTLADSLIASNGIISQRMAGKLRYLDSRKDEQERGITMKSSAISLHHSYGEQQFLVNLMDSPGHVDFSGEVSTAIRLCDGALVLVDIIEGVCPQTKVALRQAWLEHIKPVLVLNKVDRLILEKKFTPLDAYIHIQQVLEQVNAIMGELFATEVLEKTSKVDIETSAAVKKSSEEQYTDWSCGLEESDDSTLYFVPEQGNVVFASAYDSWGFSIAHFAKMYAQKLGFKEDVLRRTLWGDFYIKNKRIFKGAQAKSKKPLFVQLVLENIWSVYEAVMIRRDKEGIEKIISSLNLTVSPRDLKHADPRVQIQSICSKWLPLASAVLDMVVALVPSASELSQERIEALMCTSSRSFHSLPAEVQKLKENFLSCSSDEDAPVIVCISKMFPVDKQNLPQNKRRPITTEEIQMMRELVRQRRAEQQAGQLASPSEDSSSAASTIQQEVPKSETPENKGPVFVAFARIFSGKLTKGKKLYVLGPKHDPVKILMQSDPVNPEFTLKDLGPSQHITLATIKELYLIMGRELESLDSVGAGNILGIGGLEDHVLKSATLSSNLACPPFVDLHISSPPILRVALEAAHPNEMSALVDGLKLLNQADPCAQVLVQESGEHVLITSGEVHLQRCLDDLRERFARIEINVSDPIVPFRETIISPPKVDMVNEAIEDKSTGLKVHKTTDDKTEGLPEGTIVVYTQSQRSCIQLRAIPLPSDVSQFLENNVHLIKIQDRRNRRHQEILVDLSQDTLKELVGFKTELSRLLSEAGPEWDDAVNQIWSFGPRRCGPNLLLNRVVEFKRSSVWADANTVDTTSIYSEYDNSFISGFQLATLQGPLCEEPMMGVCFVVERWEIQQVEDEGGTASANPHGSLSGQIMSAVKDGCRRAFQAQPQRLMAAMYSCNIQLTTEVLGKMYAVLGRRHGRVLGGDLREGSQTFSIEAALPVVESFQFANEIRKQTSGMAIPQLFFSHWEVVDVDPFWVPTTEEEYLHFGEKADSDNRALKYINGVRRRKGLPVTEKIVAHAEKQRTLAKKK